MIFFTCAVLLSHRGLSLNGSLTIAPTLTQPLTLTGEQFSSGAIAWLPPTLKLTLTLTQTATLPGGQFSGYQFKQNYCILLLNDRLQHNKKTEN